MDIQQFQERIDKVCAHYDAAEADLKVVGRDTDELTIAGVNQCRYAGQHLIRALKAINEGRAEAADKELSAADAHARRAIYDINDAGIQFYISAIEKFRLAYRINWASVVPNYGKVIEDVTKAETRIEEITRSSTPREESYGLIRSDLKTLKDSYKLLTKYESDAAAEVERLQRTVTLFWIRLWTTIAVAAVGIGATAFFM